MNNNKFEVIATDTSKLQSAWSSYDSKYYGFVDYRADESFIECVNDFIYQKELRTPLPEDNQGITNPFMDLWYDSKNNLPYPKNNPIAKDGALEILSSSVETELKNNFFNDIIRFPDKYLTYYNFQFCDRITEEYISRTTCNAVNSAKLIVDSSDLLGDFKKVLSADILSKYNSINLSKWHEEICRHHTKLTNSEYAICYAYSVFRRGRQYLESLENTTYSPHWLREPSQFLKTFDESREFAKADIESTNWGSIILKLRKDGYINNGSSEFKEILVSLREDTQSGKYMNKRQAEEDNIKMLENAGIYANYSRKPLHHKIAEIPRNIIKEILPIGKPISNFLVFIELFGKSEFLRKFDAKATRCVSFENYKNSFYIYDIVGDKR